LDSFRAVSILFSSARKLKIFLVAGDKIFNNRKKNLLIHFLELLTGKKLDGFEVLKSERGEISPQALLFEQFF